MAELKTKPNEQRVEEFLNAIPDERKRRDAFAIVEIMQKATKARPKMWGSSIVGFGDRHYQYESGREGDWFVVGFSPRKQNLTLYVLSGFDGEDELLEKLGKHKTGKSCLYINTLEDIHLPTLKELVKKSVQHTNKRC